MKGDIQLIYALSFSALVTAHVPSQTSLITNLPSSCKCEISAFVKAPTGMLRIVLAADMSSSRSTRDCASSG